MRKVQGEPSTLPAALVPDVKCSRTEGGKAILSPSPWIDVAWKRELVEAETGWTPKCPAKSQQIRQTVWDREDEQ